MLTTYRSRLYPTKTQENLLNETLETCGLRFNDLLADLRENHAGLSDKASYSSSNLTDLGKNVLN